MATLYFWSRKLKGGVFEVLGGCDWSQWQVTISTHFWVPFVLSEKIDFLSLEIPISKAILKMQVLNQVCFGVWRKEVDHIAASTL